MSDIFEFFLDNIVVITIVGVFLLFSISAAIVLYDSHKQKKKREQIREQIKGLANNTLELTPEQFFEMRNYRCGGQGRPYYSLNYNFAGVYILFNKSKNKYYVGQAEQILNRVNMHFTGKGNGDVYADFKYGDIFTIKMIALENSGFATLNELERNTIMTYDSYATGYNKTRGNRT